MQWKYIPWKLDILSFPMNQESSNLDHKPEGYACLKLGLSRVWMYLMQNAWRCVNACDYGSCCSCLFQKRVLPPLARPRRVRMMGAWILFAATRFSHQKTSRDTPLPPWCIRIWLQHDCLLSSHLFICFSSTFSCARPLLYKGHILESFQSINFRDI